MIARSSARCLALFACLAAFAAWQASIAGAHTGEFAKFNYCPSTNAEAFKCIDSITESGEVVLGNKTVPIVNPVTLQGAFAKPVAETHQSKFIAATNGITLSKTPQPVPGGLLGIVPPASSPPLVKTLSKFFFENGLTGVNATLELAKPASEIRISERNLLFAEGPAFVLPVKVHLENPFLGANCYVGSSSAPLNWQLTTGATSPPSPNTSISGSPGVFEPIEEALIAKNKEAKFVDNAWGPAPTASGCGGILSFLVNPIINSMIGLPAAAGHNTAILNATNYLATASAVNAH